MHSHLDVEIAGKSLTLPEDFSISIEERNPLFYETEMFSLPVPIPLRGNRDIIKNVEVPQSDVRPLDIEYQPVRVRVDGMPFKSGVVCISEDEEIEDHITFNVDAARMSFADLIGDLECQDVPIKDKIQVGEKIGNVKVEVKYEYRVKVHYHSGKKDEWDEFPFSDSETISGVFEPQALGFSFPGVCQVTGEKQKAVPDIFKGREYQNGNHVTVPKILTSYINVADPYPGKPYCNARVAYTHHGLNDDGTTSDGLPDVDKIDKSAREEHYPYWVLDADRPQSGLCFYVLYFLECLFQHLNVSYDLSALMDIEDFKHLCFFTTHHKYYTEVAHEGTEPERYKEGDNIPAGKQIGDIVTHGVYQEGDDIPEGYYPGDEIPVMQGFFCNETQSRYQKPPRISITINGRAPSTTTKIWKEYSETEFNQILFGDINTWLNSRGCGGQLVLAYPESKQVQDFDYIKNGVKSRVVVGKDNVVSIEIEPKVRWARVSANILSMYASSENFPEESVKTVLDSLENSFGIKFHYDYEQKKVTAYLLRDVFRNKNREDPIDFLGQIKSMNKVAEKIAGVRMAYSAESDSKEQRRNVKRGIKNYDTDYDYIDYPEDKTVVGLTYREISNLPKSQQKENLQTYVDITTGNTYRWKTSAEALEKGDYKISLFQVATFKGVELGDCSTANQDYIREFISDFVPVPFSDVNYRISEMMVAPDAKKSMVKDGDTYEVANFNSDYSPLLSAYIDEDMEHEFVEQYINNALPSAFVDIYLTEQLKLVESYDPNSTDDGNSPLQHIDWGLAIAIMQGGGADAQIQLYDYNYDWMGNSKWRRVPGQYALTSDSIDMYGNSYDYNGEQPGDGGGERFSLKIRSYAPFVYYIDNAGRFHMNRDISLEGKQVEGVPGQIWVIPCAGDVLDDSGKIIKKIRSRGLCESFQSEHFHFLLNRKVFRVGVLATAAQLNDITNHWRSRYRINGHVGWIGKINYDIHKNEGIQNAILEFYTL